MNIVLLFHSLLILIFQLIIWEVLGLFGKSRVRDNRALLFHSLRNLIFLSILIDYFGNYIFLEVISL